MGRQTFHSRHKRRRRSTLATKKRQRRFRQTHSSQRLSTEELESRRMLAVDFQLEADIEVGAAGSYAGDKAGFTVLGTTLYFDAKTAATGNELATIDTAKSRD